MKQFLAVFFLLTSFTASINGQRTNCQYVPFDDHEFRIQSPAGIALKRTEIIRAIWGTDQLPDRSNVRVTTGIAAPIETRKATSRVDRFEIPVERTEGLTDLAYLFIPVNRNNRLVMLCPGHTCSLGDSTLGIESAIQGLLQSGFDVLAVFMPHVTEDSCNLDHCSVYNTPLGFQDPPSTYGLRLFLEPTLVSLNYLLGQNQYRDVNMVGLSGGGWTTNLMAALDDRIRLSFSVAGSMPYYFRSGGSVGDIEQFVPGLYRDIAGYPDLYLLGCSGKGRMLTQVYNRQDDCCFGEKQHDRGRNYTQDLEDFNNAMQEQTARLGMPGHYLQVIDEVAPNHRISGYALHQIILPGLWNQDESVDAELVKVRDRLTGTRCTW